MIVVNDGNKRRTIPCTGTVLESLENSGVRVQSHCRGGFCGSCRVKKSKGEVLYKTEPLGYFDKETEVLACVCVPVSEDLVIDVQ